MNNSGVITNNDLSGKIYQKKVGLTKHILKDELEKKSKIEKLNLIFKSLDNEGIKYDKNVQDLHELKKTIKENNEKKAYERGLSIINNVVNEIDNLCTKLKNGSSSAFTNFAKFGYNNLAKPLAKSSTISLASRAAFVLAPTLGTKAAVGAFMAGRSAYKIVKGDKYKTVVDKEYELNRILEELELTTDSNGNVIDTRFNEEIQKEIRNFFKEKNITFNDLGYLSLRNQIYNLDFELKKELCNIISTKLNNKINVNERIDKINNNFFQKLKGKSKIIGTLAGTGIGVATTINSIDPAILAAPVNSMLSNSIVKEITNSKLITNIATIGSGIGTFVTEHLPFIGKLAEGAFATENLAVCASSAIGIGMLGITGVELASIIKNFYSKFKDRKNKSEIDKLDKEKYGLLDQEELKKLKANIINRENTPEEQFIINIVYKYTDEFGINLNSKPQNIQGLKEVINQLDPENKNKVKKLLTELQNMNQKDNQTFKDKMKKVGNILINAGLVGMASLSIVDILKGGGFLPNLSKELFPGPKNIYNIESQLQENLIDTGENNFYTENQIRDKVNDKYPDISQGYTNRRNEKMLYGMSDTEIEEAESIYKTIINKGSENYSYIPPADQNYLERLKNFFTGKSTKFVGDYIKNNWTGNDEALKYLNSLSNEQKVNLGRYMLSGKADSQIKNQLQESNFTTVFETIFTPDKNGDPYDMVQHAITYQKEQEIAGILQQQSTKRGALFKNLFSLTKQNEYFRKYCEEANKGNPIDPSFFSNTIKTQEQCTDYLQVANECINKHNEPLLETIRVTDKANEIIKKVGTPVMGASELYSEYYKTKTGSNTNKYEECKTEETKGRSR